MFAFSLPCHGKYQCSHRFDVSSWYALLLPGATPAAVAERLREEALRALQHVDVQQAMARQGLEVETSAPSELGARIEAETAVWAGVIKEAGISERSR